MHISHDPIDMTDETAVRDALVRACLPHVAFDGWTIATLKAAAESLSIPPALAADYFDNDPLNLVCHHSRMADRAMSDAIAAAEGFSDKGVSAKIATAIMLRLEALADEREAVRRALSLLTARGAARTSSKLVWATCDAIWTACGDTSSDFNYYSKRGLLSGVYSSTLMTWLDDDSEDLADTRAFLDRRIGNVLKIFGGIGRLRKAFTQKPAQNA